MGAPELVKSTNGGESDQLQAFETFLSTINHVFIGFISIFITWYAFKGNITTTPLHAWLCIIGFQFIAAEGIIMLYPGNPFAAILPHKWRKTLHWVLQVIGTVLGVAGVILLYCNRTKAHFSSTHGLLGLIGSVFMLLNLLVGIITYFSRNLSKYIRPVTIKMFHNCIGVCGLTVALVSLYYGYNHLTRQIDLSFVLLLQVLTILTIVLTAIGSIKSFSNQIRDVLSIN